MKRFTFVFGAILAVGVFFATAATSPVAAASCVPQWHVVQSTSIYSSPPTFHPLGTVSLSRDGCGDIQATLTPAYNQFNPITSGSLTITDANTGTVIFTGNSNPSQTSPVLAGYGGIGIFATGTLRATFAGVAGRASTPTDYGF